ncbi:MAG: hypothetical protein HYY01_02305 [Chloroflexi bacterium]|nr:hypothetical protein [Chloroflexota bacterium]
MGLAVHLYGEAACPGLDMARLVGYLKGWLPSLEVDVRPTLLQALVGDGPAMEALAQGWARAKVRRADRPLERSFAPLYGEVAYERRRLSGASSAWGILYDGFEIALLLRPMIPATERNLGHLHIVFTRQMLGTWEEADHRYHARVGIYSFPCLLSVSGLTEALAKPREYHLLQRQYQALGVPDAAAVELEPAFRGRTIQPDAPRLTDIMAGYVAQALFYHLTGDPFCTDKGCRLYNAHWQEEALHAQLSAHYEFCPQHQRMLNEL